MQKEGSVALWSYHLWQHQVFVKLFKSFKLIETKVLLPELLSYEITAVMEDSGKSTGNVCCYIKSTANRNGVTVLCVAVVWVGDQKSVEDDRNVLAGLCLHSIKAFSIYHSPCEPGGAWGCRKSWEGHSQDSWPQGCSIPHHSMLSIWTWGKKRVMFGSPRIPKQPLHMVKLSFTENGWISAFPQEAENEFLILLCLCIQLLLYPMNYLSLTPGVFSHVWHSSDSSVVIAELLAQVSNQGNQRWIMLVNCYHIIHFCSHCQCRAFFWCR